MVPGHSGGPGLNQHGEVVGWNVRQARQAVRDEQSFTVSFQDGSSRVHTLSVARGINELRPVSRLVAELQALHGQAAIDAWGCAQIDDVRTFLAARHGRIAADTHAFGPAAFKVALDAAEKRAKEFARQAKLAKEAAEEAQAKAEGHAAAAAGHAESAREAGMRGAMIGHASAELKKGLKQACGAVVDLQAQGVVLDADYLSSAVAALSNAVPESLRFANTGGPSCASVRTSAMESLSAGSSGRLGGAEGGTLTLILTLSLSLSLSLSLRLTLTPAPTLTLFT
jgi:hypothetical protein